MTLEQLKSGYKIYDELRDLEFSLKTIEASNPEDVFMRCLDFASMNNRELWQDIANYGISVVKGHINNRMFQLKEELKEL